MRWYIILGLVLYNFIQGISQIPTWKEVDFQQNIKVKNVSIDTMGFLWLLTESTFYKYDGLELISKVESSDDLGNFHTIVKDTFGGFQIGTEEGVIISFNPYENVQIPYKFLNDSIPISFLFCPDPNNICIAISYGNGIGIKYKENFHWITEENLLISNEAYSASIQDNIITIATDQGIQKFQITNDSLISMGFPLNNELLDVITTNIIVNDKETWISYFSGGISRIEGKQISHFPLTGTGKINNILLKNQDVYVASENGLFIFSEGQWTKKYPSSRREEVVDFDFDDEGNLWLVNGRGKLIYASLLFQKFNFEVQQIQAIENINDDLWIGNQNGLYVIEGNELKEILQKNITSLAFVNGLIWVGTFSSGFYILNENGQILKHLSYWENYDNQSVLYLCVDENEVYISSLTGIIQFEYFNDSNSVRFQDFKSLNNQLGEGYFYQILKNGDKMYFATDGEGLKILQNDTVTVIDQFQDGSKLESVYSMEIDNYDRLWFSSSSGGLGHFSDGTAFIRSQEKNSSDHYTSLKKLQSGQILMVRSGSIDIMNPDLDYIIYHEKEINFSEEPPFLNSIVAVGNKAYFSHGNTIYEYNQISNLKTKPQVQLDEVLVNLDKARTKNKFKQEENNFQFVISSSWLTDPGKVSFKYKLDGFDPNWRYSKDRSISYPKLTPGSYSFMIKGSENGEFADGGNLTYDFKISRYFYNSWWFWGLVFVTLTIGIAKWRDERKRIQLKQSLIEKKHIETQLSNLKSQLNPHFLFNAFNTLMGLIEEDQDRSLSFVEKLTDFYRLVLEQGKNQLILLSEELTLVTIFVDILNERFNNALNISISDFENSVYIPPLTIQLLIENAVKHNEVGHNQKLNISIYEEGEYVVVKNNLIPKKYRVKSTGSGLENIKKRYLLLNPKRIKIHNDNIDFVVKLPKIHSNVNQIQTSNKIK